MQCPAYRCTASSTAAPLISTTIFPRQPYSRLTLIKMTSPLGPPPAYTASDVGLTNDAATDAAKQIRLGVRTDALIMAAQREYELTQNPSNWGTRRTHPHVRQGPEPEPEAEGLLLRFLRLMAPPIADPNSHMGLLYIW